MRRWRFSARFDFYVGITIIAVSYTHLEERFGDTKRLSVVDMEIENVIHIEQPEDGVIAFYVIASCDVEMPSASHKGYFNAVSYTHLGSISFAEI